jgi:anti-sigma B factor antagonist
MLAISATITDAGPVLVLSGEFDLTAADRVCDAADSLLAAADGKRLTVDLAAVSFIDAAGLGALVMMSNAAADAGTTLRVRGAPARIAKLLELTGLSEVLAAER